MKTTIIYHDNCHDGITALWCALQAIPDATPYAATHSAKPDLDKLRGQNCVFVDFCWGLEVMREIARVAASMLVLDHHKSALSDMFAPNRGLPHVLNATAWAPGGMTWQRHMQNVYQDECENAHINGAIIYCVFDMERSGAGLAWDVLVGGPRPTLVNYVEDRDLWRFALPMSREVHAACGLRPLTVEDRDALMREPIQALRVTGSLVLQYHDRLCADAARFALRETIGGHDVPSVSLPLLALGSDVAHILCKNEPFAAYWMDRPDGTRYYGLRSVEGGLDVSEIAKQYGGGGHRHAAGFTREVPR